MSLIKIKCEDQVLHIEQNPSIYSGDVNYDSVEFTFCENWTDFLKTAVFYNDPKTPYMRILDVNNTCVIPKEVLASKGYVYIGVFGTKDNVVITSQILKYRILEGVPTENLEEPDPNPDILTQILSNYNEVKVALESDYKGVKETLDADYTAVKEDLTNGYNTFTNEVNNNMNELNNNFTNLTESVGATLGEFEEDLSNKSDNGHTHDDLYYTETEVANMLGEKLNANNIKVLQTAVSLTNGVGSVDIDYPSGWSYDNSYILSAMEIYQFQTKRWGYETPKISATLTSSVIRATVNSSSTASSTRVAIVLYKHALIA